MRNLNTREINLISGGEMVIVNTLTPDYFSNAFFAGMVGEPFSLGWDTIATGILVGIAAECQIVPAGFIGGALLGLTIGALYDAKEYYYGKNYTKFQKLRE